MTPTLINTDQQTFLWIFVGDSEDDELIGFRGFVYFEGRDGNDLFDQEGPIDIQEEDEDGDEEISDRAFVVGGRGNDRLISGQGQDTIEGGKGHDFIDAKSGNDQLSGGSGKDQLFGRNGRDFLDGGDGNDFIVGGRNTDYLIGGGGKDTLKAGPDNDLLQGGDGNDYLNAGSGDDFLDGGTGNDTLVGGSGDDAYAINLGRAKVMDYELGEIIQYDEEVVGSSYTLEQSGENLLIRMDNPDARMLLFNTNKNSFSVDWIKPFPVEADQSALLAG